MKDSKTTIRPRLRASSVAGRPGTVYFHIYHAGRSTQLVTPVRLDLQHWDEAAGQVRLPREAAHGSGEPHRLRHARTQLQHLHRRLEDIVAQLHAGHAAFTVDDIRRHFRQEADAPDFVSYANALIACMQSAHRMNTARNCRTALTRLTASTAARHIPFSAITQQSMQAFERQLSEEHVSPNSISCYMRSLRAVYNKAVAAGLTEQTHPFSKVYTGIARTRKRAVGIGTIRAISRLPLPPHSPLALARHLFLFSYYTRGMAFVDIAFLRKSNLVGTGTLVYHRRKTGQRIEIHLEPCIRHILRTYIGASADSPYIFPILSTTEPRQAFLQYRRFLCGYNAQLRRLAAMVHHDGSLSSYSPRHTWATEARNCGIPLSVISAAMGHTSERTTQIYLASMDNDIIDRANRKLCRNLTSAP